MDRRITKRLMAAARAQHGLLGGADVAAVDPGRSLDELVRSGIWQSVVPGVVAPAGVAVTRELLEAACMLWMPHCMLSHESASRRLGFWVPDEPCACITTPWQDTRRSRGLIRISRTRHYPPEEHRIGLLRVAAAERTIVDLAEKLTRKQLEAVLLSAIRHGATTAEQVSAAAEPLVRRPSVRLVREVVGLWTPERESRLEDRLYDDVCSVVPAHEVERQLVVQDQQGAVYARIDVAVRRLRLAFEADGLLFHSTDEQLAADHRRDRGLFARGWHTTRFREGVLDARAAVRREVREVVDRRTRDLGERRVA